MIYVMHKVPDEPRFNSKDYISGLAPVPMQLGLIEADSHRFGGQLPAFWQAPDRAFAWFESLTSQARP